jgi:hypothetical protein
LRARKRRRRVARLLQTLIIFVFACIFSCSGLCVRRKRPDTGSGVA